MNLKQNEVNNNGQQKLADHQGHDLDVGIVSPCSWWRRENGSACRTPGWLQRGVRRLGEGSVCSRRQCNNRSQWSLWTDQNPALPSADCVRLAHDPDNLRPTYSDKLMHDPDKLRPTYSDMLMHDPDKLWPTYSDKLMHDPDKLRPTYSDKLMHDPDKLWPTYSDKLMDDPNKLRPTYSDKLMHDPDKLRPTYSDMLMHDPICSDLNTVTS